MRPDSSKDRLGRVAWPGPCPAPEQLFEASRPRTWVGTQNHRFKAVNLVYAHENGGRLKNPRNEVFLKPFHTCCAQIGVQVGNGALDLQVRNVLVGDSRNHIYQCIIKKEMPDVCTIGAALACRMAIVDKPAEPRPVLIRRIPDFCKLLQGLCRHRPLLAVRSHESLVILNCHKTMTGARLQALPKTLEIGTPSRRVFSRNIKSSSRSFNGPSVSICFNTTDCIYSTYIIQNSRKSYQTLSKELGASRAETPKQSSLSSIIQLDDRRTNTSSHKLPLTLPQNKA